MNVVIPENYKEGQLFFDRLKSLTFEELENVKHLYWSQRHAELTVISYQFEITTSDYTISFFNKSYILFSTKTEKGARQYRERYDGSKEWFLNKEIHREDGPASVSQNGMKRYFYNGKDLGKLILSIWPMAPKKKILFGFDFYFIQSLTEFLWENGYQFDEYLPGGYQIKEKHLEACEKILKKIERGKISEGEILKELQDIYCYDILSKKFKHLAAKAENHDDDACMEILKNIKLIESNPLPKEIFHNWQTYDEIQESFSLKAFWN